MQFSVLEYVPLVETRGSIFKIKSIPLSKTKLSHLDSQQHNEKVIGAYLDSGFSNVYR